MRIAIDVAILQDKRLVVVRKEKKGRSSWILPGGKPEEGESDLVCLDRELKQELPFLVLTRPINYYASFRGVTPNTGDIIEAKVYLCQEEGPLDLRPSTNSDEPVKEARHLDYGNLSKLALSDPTTKLIESLKRNSYL